MITCIDAFKNLDVRSMHGLAIAACCLSPSISVKKIDFYNHEYLQNIRNSWKQGIWPTACNSCKTVESQGGVSRRQGANEWYRQNGITDTEPALVRLDYWTGDLCNLACVICDPRNSSVWKQELNYPIHSKKTNINSLWEGLDTSQLRYVHFNGGEPLLSKEHVKFLQALPDKHLIHVSYNTNGTVQVSQELLDLWSEYKLVQLEFSIDDVGARYEYQRYPAKWPDVVNNLQWYIDHAPHNCMFAVNSTVSILNHHNLDNLNQWLQQNFYESRFLDPIEHRQQPAFGRFALSGNRQLALKFLDDCDARRGTNWRETFPELDD